MHAVIAQISWDHSIIRIGLQAAGSMAENDTLANDKALATEVVEFLTRYMDQYHHGKEEKFVFPLLLDGPPPVKAMVPQLIEEHQVARDYIAQMSSAVGSGDRTGLNRSTQALVAHMFQHIGKEDSFAFPLMLDTTADPGMDLTTMGKQNEFIMKEIGMEYLMRAPAFVYHLEARALREAAQAKPTMMVRA